MSDEPRRTAVTAGGSRRVAEAGAVAVARLERQRDTLRPLGLAVIVLVAAGAIGGSPAPALHGKGVAVLAAVCVFAAAMALAIRPYMDGRSGAVQIVVIAAMGAAGVALTALQPHDATGLAGSAAVWMAVARLPLPAGVSLALAIALGLGLAGALAGASAAGVLATLLLCALLAVMARFMRLAREGQSRTEALMAQLEDAREQQTLAAASAERSRIAAELHDVLAHSLSGAAIQLEAVRVIAERELAEPKLRVAVDRASELVKEGLANARQAVGALRGEELPGVERLDALVESFRGDLRVAAELQIEGTPRPLPPDVSLALYRGAQEALTNVARHAPGAAAVVVLRYEGTHAVLSVENDVPGETPVTGDDSLSAAGGGKGLVGMRERVERAGGSVEAGPTEHGWSVRVALPA